MAYIPSHRKKHMAKEVLPRLQLTSMMDMFTIILVFLLKIYSTHGQLIVPSDDLTLPESMTQFQPELGLDVIISSEYILINNKPVERTAEIESSDVFIIPPLQNELLRYAREAERMQELYGIPFSGRVTIQADKKLSYRLLMKIMATCGQSRYPNMRLIVYSEQG